MVCMLFWRAPVCVDGVNWLPCNTSYVTKLATLQRWTNLYGTENVFYLFLLNELLLQKATIQMSSETANDFYFLMLIQTSPSALANSFIPSNVFSLPFLWLAWAVRQYVLCSPGGIRRKKKQREVANQEIQVPWQGQYVSDLSTRPASSQET